MASNTNKFNDKDLQNLFSSGASGLCHSEAAKLVIPIPKMAGKPLLDKDQNPIKDWEGNPVKGEGFVFINSVASGNPTEQAVRTNGLEVVIINNPTEDHIKEINKIFSAPSVDGLIDGDHSRRLNEFFSYAEKNKLDAYNSTNEFVSKKMTSPDGSPVNMGEETDSRNPIQVLPLKRDGQPVEYIELSQAGFYAGGPTAKGEQFEAGTIAIKDGDKFRLVDGHVFNETYKVDKKPAPSQEYNEIASPKNKVDYAEKSYAEKSRRESDAALGRALLKVSAARFAAKFSASTELGEDKYILSHSLKNKRGFLESVRGKDEQDSGLFSKKYTEDLLSRPPMGADELCKIAGTRESLFAKPHQHNISIDEVKTIMRDQVEQKAEGSSNQSNTQSNT